MEYELLKKEYEAFRARGLVLNMARGCPSREQLDLSLPMLEPLRDFTAEDGTDVRNYGNVTGIPEIKRLFGELMGVPAAQVIAGGGSSIHLMHAALSRAYVHGPKEGAAPWGQLKEVKIICPVPGYDWHFHLLDSFGFTVVPVPLYENGPDIEKILELVKDPAVKGLVCVPMYSNPSGVTCSAAVVEALAGMETAADDFTIFWDNAYCVHHLYEDRRASLANLYTASLKYGHEDRVLMFASTSKMTFAGGGVAAMAASPAVIRRHTSFLQYELVSFDKVNQLRHARFLPDLKAVEAHMKKHAAILRPKFNLVEEAFEKELSGLCTFTRPLGGYFICLNVPDGCAKRTVALCKEAGVSLTPAGAPFPGGREEKDSLLRIAPTMPPLGELSEALRLIPLAVKLAYAEKQR